MNLSYYPGCTLKTRAANLEDAALAALRHLGIEIEELPRWNCCGAVFSLADDDLIHHVAAVRNLIRVMQQGSDTVVTLCSQCYNTLARANQLMRDDDDKRKTLNLFLDEEPDYEGQVEVLHYLTFLRDHVGWDVLRQKVKVPLEGLKVAPFYGCTLVRPTEVAIEAPDEQLMADFLTAIGATPVEFSAARECCGSYQVVANPTAATAQAGQVIASANRSAADALILSCPLCEFSLGTQQSLILNSCADTQPVPTYYFTQLLAVALGLEARVCRFDLNEPAALRLFKDRKFIAAPTA